ncbi:MAG TPA: uroporphyrinogen decarboxylase family protein [bacterium]|nr:uroporphyrinogen decarboxylase family protein [bacterium]
MTSRERISRILNHRIPDRVAIHDSVWDATIKRWHKEGLPEDTLPSEYFGYEFNISGPDLTPRFPISTVEQNEEFIITTTPFGGKRKNHRDYSTTPEIIDWPIKTKEDWKEIKKRLTPDMTRVDWAAGLRNNRSAYEAGKFTCFSCVSGYDALQNYMKSEQILITMAEDPAWIKEIIMTLAELSIVMADLMLKNGFKFDGLFAYNDMGYRNGLLFSTETYRKTHYEADRLLYEYFHSKGMKTILHSCGNVTEIIPILIETGLDCIQPLEVKAGMDIISLKEKFGDKISFMGGIDVRLMSENDTAGIEEEIKNKFEAAKKNGGYIYHSDHSIPKNVSFQQYCRVMELVKKYGNYPEYEEGKQEENLEQQAETVAPTGKSMLRRGRKKVATAEEQDAAKVIQAEAPTIKEKKGLFGRKMKDVKEKQEVKPETETKSEAKEGKKFKLPFGKKK